MVPIARSDWRVRVEVEQLFPQIIGSRWNIASPFDRVYNCFAWAACDVNRRWEPTPDEYWPIADRTYDIDCFIRAFATLGYEPCGMDYTRKLGWQKIAIFSEVFMNEEWPAHIARQRIVGRGWHSKLGELEDIVHYDLNALQGYRYGRVVLILRRSWWSSLVNFCCFKCASASWSHWWYRRQHPHGV